MQARDARDGAAALCQKRESMCESSRHDRRLSAAGSSRSRGVAARVFPRFNAGFSMAAIDSTAASHMTCGSESKDQGWTFYAHGLFLFEMKKQLKVQKP